MKEFKRLDAGREDGVEKKKKLSYSRGIIYFDRKTERSVFFILTIIMLLWGILAKLGLF